MIVSGVVKIAASLRRLPAHRACFWLTQILALIVSGTASFLLRFDFQIPPAYQAHLAAGLLVWLPVKAVVFYLRRLDRFSWRFASTYELTSIASAVLIGSLLSALLIHWLGPAGFPRSIFLLDLLITFVLTAGVRLAARVAAEAIASLARAESVRRRVLIYGAGAAGVSLIRELRANTNLPYEPVGFLDDDPTKAGSRIMAVRVLGTGREIADHIRRHDVSEVLIAMPSIRGARMAEVISRCQNAGVRFRMIPDMSELIAGNVFRHIRDVAVEDVLGRAPVDLNRAEMVRKLQGKVVLVTGAAGSIGSELCRQIARFGPACLVLFDAAETPAFHLNNELRQSFPDLPLHAEIGNIQSTYRLTDVFARYKPEIVYHAAAYKHVPMMEANAFEAIENNVFGTYNVAVTAARHGVDDFVMISSDKAVRPTNIMGASKRAAELVIRSLQNGGTRFVSVRFGNVLGSNGSVVPIFKEQIAAGGPVTVTHPEMRRYFMTMPEAAQLVLQASTMGKGGEIFVLDMGTPVKIVDLARQLIILSGLKPDEDIRIEFSGTRPGEKLYEELRFSDEEVVPTSHSKIKVFAGHSLPDNRMAEHLGRLRSACERRDLKALLFELKEIEPDYNPGKEVLNRAFEADLARLTEAVSSASAVTPNPAPVFMTSGD